MFLDNLKKEYRYNLFASGVRYKSKVFNTRREAEIAMLEYCSKNHITGVECVEFDKHERKYSNHNGVRFYINRI